MRFLPAATFLKTMGLAGAAFAATLESAFSRIPVPENHRRHLTAFQGG